MASLVILFAFMIFIAWPKWIKWEVTLRYCLICHYVFNSSIEASNLDSPRIGDSLHGRCVPSGEGTSTKASSKWSSPWACGRGYGSWGEPCSNCRSLPIFDSLFDLNDFRLVWLLHFFYNLIVGEVIEVVATASYGHCSVRGRPAGSTSTGAGDSKGLRQYW